MLYLYEWTDIVDKNLKYVALKNVEKTGGFQYYFSMQKKKFLEKILFEHTKGFVKSIAFNTKGRLEDGISYFVTIDDRFVLLNFIQTIYKKVPAELIDVINNGTLKGFEVDNNVEPFDYQFTKDKLTITLITGDTYHTDREQKEVVDKFYDVLMDWCHDLYSWLNKTLYTIDFLDKEEHLKKYVGMRKMYFDKDGNIVYIHS